MLKYACSRSVVLLLTLVTAFALFAQAASQRNPRALELIVEIPTVKTDTNNPRIEIPIYVTNAVDSIAGFQLWFALSEPFVIRFKPAAVPGRATAAEIDTAGTLISGWESLETNIIDYPTGAMLRVVGLANLPQGSQQPGFAPGSGVLLKLICEAVGDQADSLCDSVQIGVFANVPQCAFSDPQGNLLAYSCSTYVDPEIGPVQVCWFDTTLGAYDDGSVDFACCHCGDSDCNGIVTISDAVCMIQYVFGGIGPCVTLFPGCGDADDNGIITISDAVRIINYIFGGGPGLGLCHGAVCH